MVWGTPKSLTSMGPVNLEVSTPKLFGCGLERLLVLASRRSQTVKRSVRSWPPSRFSSSLSLHLHADRIIAQSVVLWCLLLADSLINLTSFHFPPAATAICTSTSDRQFARQLSSLETLIITALENTTRFALFVTVPSDYDTLQPNTHALSQYTTPSGVAADLIVR